MLHCLFYILLSFVSIIFGLSCILVDDFQVSPLLMHLGVDLLGDCIDVLHGLLYMLEVLIPLVDDVPHVVRLRLDLYLLLVKAVCQFLSLHGA